MGLASQARSRRCPYTPATIAVVAAFGATFKEAERLAYTKAGVDSGEIVVRGGSHLDFSFIPNQAFGASLRGPDVTDWYLTAWFDRYLTHAPGATDRLLSERWRDDPVEAGVDPSHDGNAFSFYYYSRLGHRPGRRRAL